MEEVDESSQCSGDCFDECDSDGSKESTEETTTGSQACKLEIVEETTKSRSQRVEADELLSSKALLDTAVKECCRSNCILNLSPQNQFGNMTEGVAAIRNARLPLVRLNSEQQYDLLKNKLTGIV